MGLGNLFGSRDRSRSEAARIADGAVAAGINLPEDQREQLAREVSMLENRSGVHTRKLQDDAEKKVLSAVQDSVRKLHVVELGRCPSCGERLFQHLGANICDACGWHQYDHPKRGEVRVHLSNGECVHGERAHVLKNGDCLVVHDGVVCAQIPRHAFSWVEYVWNNGELEQRKFDANSKLIVKCGWCGQETDPNQDGFHLVHAAFGSSQERYCFCCDDCYEAFRKMYPSRVDRDCYERDCTDCDKCLKRYDDEASEMRILAKDYIRNLKN